MDVIRSRANLVKTNWLLAALTVIFLIAWQMPPLKILDGIVLMSLPTHMFAETFSIIVSMLVFALVFSTSKEDHPENPVILASAFFVVGLLDFAHTLSYVGMPVFVTPGSIEKGIYFWLVARYVAAIALLVVSIQLWKKNTRPFNRYGLLLVSLILTGCFYWLGLYHLDAMPRTFIPGKGLTTFKVLAEYGVVAILLIPAIIFYRQTKTPQSFDTRGLYAATVITILSELCFTLYANVTGIFILLGHIYKVVAYIYIFKAIFVFVVRQPYQKLFESEQYNRTLFESSPIGLAVCKTDGSFLDVNQACADIVGRSIEDIKRLTYWQVTPIDYAEQEQAQLKSLESRGCYGPYEKEYLHKDGHRVPVRLSGRLIERNGETLIWSSIEDISDEVAAERARYESEQHLRQLAEHIREVFWLTDTTKSKIVYTSPAYEAVWGRSCEELYANPMSFIEAIHPEDYQRVKSAIMRQAEGPYTEEFRIIRPDGSIRWVKEQSFPIRDQHGKIYRIAGVAEDITEEKLAHELLEQRVAERTEILHKKEEELIVARDEAERANLAKTHFLSRMSHELRTPLNAILGFSQLLELDETLNSSQQESVSEIYHGGKHLLELIDEVLDLARIETGHYDIAIRPVDLRAVLQECISLSAPLAAKNQVVLTIQTDASLEAVVQADVTRLKQIILNLISNACKYNQPGGIVDVAYTRTSEGKVRLTVRDTGEGLTHEQLEVIFEPFNRLGAEYSAIEGTGIGLTISKQLIEMLGGSIGVESVPGQGSVFWIDLLPADNTTDSLVQTNTDTNSYIKHGAQENNAKHTILYIEDQTANLRLVEKILRQCPEYYLMTAVTAEQGVEFALQYQPSLILLDINLPGMNGYEVMEIFRASQETSRIPVIAVSANAMLDDLEKGRGAGFKDYLTKPIDVEDFIQTIRRWLPDEK